MPRQSAVTTLANLIEDLRQQRQVHADALAEIDALFVQYGVATQVPKRRGRKPGRKPGRPAAKVAKGRRPRGNFDQTAPEFVLGMLKKRPMMTARINAAWIKAGRGGRADTTLMNLVNSGTVKRQKVKDMQGSQYALA
jgi:hypothetical protein